MTTSPSRRPLTFASLLLACALGAFGSFALTHVEPVQARSAAADAESVTVFVDATFGMRKGHMANQLTKSHAEYAARGYRYVDMAPYNENGDLVGFFVTYTRR
jgi:predicted outer membrane lipoprotein